MIEYGENKFDQINRNVSIETNFIETIDNKKIHTEYKYIYVIQGQGTLKVNDVQYEVKENFLIPLTPYTFTEVTEIKESLKVIIFSFNRLYINKVINNISEYKLDILSDMENIGLIKLEGKVAIKIKKILLEIRNEIGDNNILQVNDNIFKDNYSDLFIISKFIEFLVIISRNIDNKVERNIHSEGQTLIKYMFAHCNEKLTINKLATIFFMSESTVRKYIYKFSELTFNELLYKMRLQKTEDLLLYTELNLDEIANLSGFVDGSHIIKIWNMKKNMTPSKYKKMYKSFDGYSENDKKLVFDLINYLKSKYYKELTVEKIAEKYGVTEVKINKLLLAYVDRNFSTYLNYIRINKACEMLLNTNDSIIDICFKVGFNNIKTFNNNFKKIKNMNPTSYKQSFLDRL